MTNAEYYGFTNKGKFTKNIDQLPKTLYNMNSIEFLKWLRKEEAPQLLTAKEKKFIADTVNSYAGLVNITTVTRIYDRKRNAYFLRFQSAHGLDLTDTFSCFNEEVFNNLEEYKAYDIKELLGED